MKEPKIEKPKAPRTSAKVSKAIVGKAGESVSIPSDANNEIQAIDGHYFTLVAKVENIAASSIVKYEWIAGGGATYTSHEPSMRFVANDAHASAAGVTHKVKVTYKNAAGADATVESSEITVKKVTLDAKLQPLSPLFKPKFLSHLGHGVTVFPGSFVEQLDADLLEYANNTDVNKPKNAVIFLLAKAKAAIDNNELLGHQYFTLATAVQYCTVLNVQGTRDGYTSIVHTDMAINSIANPTVPFHTYDYKHGSMSMTHKPDMVNLWK